jgi:glycosyltransferase involved in cell wall biosynthesis
MKPLVSVIVPNYNHAAFLQQRLDSIYNQTYSNFQVILLDDCSTDHSLQILKLFENHVRTKCLICNTVNSKSPFSQWKKGIQQADGLLLWIAESDDYADLNFLQVSVDAILSGADLCYAKNCRVNEMGAPFSGDSMYWYRDISDIRWLNSFRADAKTELRDVLFKKCVINNASAVVFKKNELTEELLNRVSGMFYSGDWLFWMLYFENISTLIYTTATTNYFRTHAGVTRVTAPERRNPENLKVLRYVLQHPLSSGQRLTLARYYFAHHFVIPARRKIRFHFLFLVAICKNVPLLILPWLKFIITGERK